MFNCLMVLPGRVLRRVRLAGAVALCSALIPGASVPALRAADAPASLLPLTIVASSALVHGGQGQTLPVVTVGMLPDGTTIAPGDFYSRERPFDWKAPTCQPDFGAEKANVRTLCAKLALGASNLLPARAGSDTVIFLESPFTGWGHAWAPVSLSRQGHSYVVNIDDWSDDISRKDDLPIRPLYLLSLGRLEAGAYSITLNDRSLFHKSDQATGGDAPDFRPRPTETDVPYYRLKSTSTAVLSFTVLRANDPAPADAALPSINAIGPESPDKTADPKAPVYQEPHQIDAQISDVAEAAKGAASAELAPSLKIGWLDLNDWLGQVPAGILKQSALPKLGDYSPKRSLCVTLVGPRLDSFQWMTLRHIEWKGKHVTLYVELWTDTGVRERNYEFFPFILTALVIPGQRTDRGDYVYEPGDYTVDVVWDSRVAAEPGGEYVRQETVPPSLSTPDLNHTQITIARDMDKDGSAAR